ncbi:hypothetical protein [Nonomuraea salmonea]|uniref:hypothetical protein n=1 Tax=Nonomuraea salmonea TaxID=46181 RepID=UPI0031E8C029
MDEARALQKRRDLADLPLAGGAGGGQGQPGGRGRGHQGRLGGDVRGPPRRTITRRWRGCGRRAR